MPDNKTPHDIFISYSRKNKDVVLRIKDEIERLGLTCWIDLSDIPCGTESFKKKVIPGIKHARIAFLFFLSTESQSSENAVKEINFAKNRAKTRVVLVRFNDDEMTDDFFFDYQDADIIDWRVPEQKEKLLRDLMSWSGKGEQTPVPPSGTVPALVICPMCGKKNDPRDTFRCCECGRDNLCLRHQDAKTFRCDDCMSKRRKEGPAIPKSRVKPPVAEPPSRAATGGGSRAERIRAFCVEERDKAWGDLHVGDGIPAEKLANFRASATRRGPDKKGILLAEPIALCDATVFGSAKNGFLLSEKGIAVSGDWSAKTSADYLSWQEFVGPAGTVLFDGGYEVLLYDARGRSVFFNAATCGRSVDDVVGFFRRLREVAGAKPASSSPAFQIVAEAFANVRSDRFWIGEKIPPSKERNARKSMNIGKQAIFALYDDTVWGGAREGFAVVASGLFFKNIAEDPVFIPWEDVRTISVAEGALFVGGNKIECGDSSLDRPAKKAVAAGLRLLTQRSPELSGGKA